MKFPDFLQTSWSTFKMPAFFQPFQTGRHHGVSLTESISTKISGYEHEYDFWIEWGYECDCKCGHEHECKYEFVCELSL